MPTLKELREDALLSQEELARLCGVSIQTVYYWERGATTPRLKHLRKLVGALGKTPAEIREAIKGTAERRKKEGRAVA